MAKPADCKFSVSLIKKPFTKRHWRYRNVFLSSTELAERQTERPSLWEQYIRCAPVPFSGKNFREEGARAAKAVAKDAPALVKKIGQTTYIVGVHFSKASKETRNDKIRRMLKNEIQQMGKSDNGNRLGIRNAPRYASDPGL